MDITLDAALTAQLTRSAQERGVTPEVLVVEVLRERFPAPRPQPPFVPQDDWERALVEMAVDCGVSLTDEQLGREEMYD